MKRFLLLILLPLTIGIVVHSRCTSPTAELLLTTVTVDRTVSAGDTAMLRFETDEYSGSCTWFIRYEDSWRLDSTSDDRFPLVWDYPDTGLHRLVVYALAEDGRRSVEDTVTLRVILGELTVAIEGDSIAFTDDTSFFRIAVPDDDRIPLELVWTKGDENPRIVPFDTAFAVVWTPGDTGMRTVCVYAVDEYGLHSQSKSIRVHVLNGAPVITALTEDTAVSLGDTLVLRCQATDGNGVILTYRWTITTAAGSVRRETADSLLPYTWTSGDIGLCEITVEAIDEDSLVSYPVHCTIQVSDVLPGLRSVSDTAVSSTDTLRITRVIVDSTQAAKQWFFAFNGGEPVESETSAVELFYQGVRRVRVVTGVLNSDSMFFADTFTVTFNCPPQIVSSLPADGDTLWMGEGLMPGTVSLPVSIIDPEGEAITTRFRWGAAQDTVTVSDSLIITVDSIGGYPFFLSVTDEFGNKIIRQGTFYVGVEHTICFAGHSIVAGLGDTTYSGGFRPYVLTALRDMAGPLGKIRAVGPFVTDHVMPDPSDDSCFAICGSLAREMRMFMDHSYPDLTADIWVLMLGANDAFSGIEAEATINLMNRMVQRNPDARIYLLTSQPYDNATEYRRDAYNGNIRNAAEVLRDSGYAAFIVETGDSTLYDEETDSFNDTLAFDVVHPNILGYRRMGDAIVKVMQERDPHVLDMKNED